MTNFNDQLFKKLDGIGYTKTVLPAAVMDPNSIKAEALEAYYRKLAYSQKYRADYEHYLELAAAVKLGKQTGQPVSAAVQKERMYIGVVPTLVSRM